MGFGVQDNQNRLHPDCLNQIKLSNYELLIARSVYLFKITTLITLKYLNLVINCMIKILVSQKISNLVFKHNWFLLFLNLRDVKLYDYSI